MSETKEAPARAKKNEVATLDEKMSPKQLGDMLKSMEPNKDRNLVADYFTMEPGEEKKVIFIEKTEMQKYNGESGEMTPAVRLLTEDGSEAINADKVLVTCLSRLPKLTPVQIVCTGETKSANGKYKTFDVHPLTAK